METSNIQLGFGRLRWSLCLDRLTGWLDQPRRFAWDAFSTEFSLSTAPFPWHQFSSCVIVDFDEAGNVQLRYVSFVAVRLL